MLVPRWDVALIEVFPWLLPQPHIVGVCEPRANSHERAVPIDKINGVTKPNYTSVTNFGSSSPPPPRLSSRTAHIKVDTPPLRLPVPKFPPEFKMQSRSGLENLYHQTRTDDNNVNSLSHIILQISSNKVQPDIARMNAPYTQA